MNSIDKIFSANNAIVSVDKGASNLIQTRPRDIPAASVQLQKETVSSDNASTKIKTEDVMKKIEKLNNILDVHNMRLSFGVEGKVFWLKVIDLEKNKVVKQIPPKEMVDYLNRVEEDLGGGTYSKLAM